MIGKPSIKKGDIKHISLLLMKNDVTRFSFEPVSSQQMFCFFLLVNQMKAFGLL
jgi:hypothetical protein